MSGHSRDEGLPEQSDEDEAPVKKKKSEHTETSQVFTLPYDEFMQPGPSCSGYGSGQKNTESDKYEYKWTILDVLNMDCWRYILEYVELGTVIASERVSRRWQSVVLQYIRSITGVDINMRIRDPDVTLRYRPRPLDVLQRCMKPLLIKLGPAVTSVAIVHSHCSDVVAEYCPNVEEIIFADTFTTGLPIVVESCKKLKSIRIANDVTMLPSVNKDEVISEIFNISDRIDEFKITNSRNINGTFLASLGSSKLRRLDFSMSDVEFDKMLSSVHNLQHLTVLKLDGNPLEVLGRIHLLLKDLVNLEHLSLCQYGDIKSNTWRGNLIYGVQKLSRLKHLYLTDNLNVTDALLKAVGDTCRELNTLNIGLQYKDGPGLVYTLVTDTGLITLCRGCPRLTHLVLNRRTRLTDASLLVLAFSCPDLVSLALQDTAVTDHGVMSCIKNCDKLTYVDVVHCRRISRELANRTERLLFTSTKYRPPIKLKTDYVHRNNNPQHCVYV